MAHFRFLSTALLALTLFAMAAWCDGPPFGANGLGLLVNDNSGRSRGMGGAGIASTDGASMLRGNPALLTSFEHPMYSISMLYDNSSTDTGEATFSFAQTDPTLIRFVVPLRGKVFIGMSIAPYTNGDCAVGMTDSLTDDGTGRSIRYTDTVTSYGGVNVTSFDLATKIRSVSLGVSMNYYFGSTNREWERTFDPADSIVNTTQYVRRQYSGYGATVGILAPIPFKSTFGAGYTMKARLATKEYVRAGSESYDERLTETRDLYLPANWRMGISSALSPKVSTAVDYSFAQWSKAARTATEKKMYHDTYSLAAGIRYAPRILPTAGYLSRIPLSAGVRTETLYYKSYSSDASKINTVRESAVTLGAEFPFPSGNGGIITSFEYGKRGEKSRNGWSESFFLIGVSLAGSIK